jgi:uncharacterized protein (TIGR02118 family)
MFKFSVTLAKRLFLTTLLLQTIVSKPVAPLSRVSPALTQDRHNMPYTVLIFAYRKPGLSPAEFKSHYESSHVPLVQSLTGSLFPKSHTRRYIQRADSANHPATVLVGTQADFEYDAIAELIFDDEGAFQAFFACVSEAKAAEKIAQDEDKFLDRTKMKVVIEGDSIVTYGGKRV